MGRSVGGEYYFELEANLLPYQDDTQIIFLFLVNIYLSRCGACRNLCAFYDDNVLTEHVCQRWFQRVHDREIRIEGQLSLVRPNELESDKLLH